MTAFAAAEIQAVLDTLAEARNGGFRIELRLADEDAHLGKEDFRLTKEGNLIVVVGGAAAGTMYGGLELAEQLRLFGLSGVEPAAGSPHLARRGTKFNIPLDLRTPSYTGHRRTVSKSTLDQPGGVR